MTGPLTIVVADDHALVRRCLAEMLTRPPALQVVADVSTTDEAITAAIRHQPDIVILDIDIPGVGSFEAAKIIQSRCPKTKIMFLSAFSHDRYIEAALKAGAMAYVTKTDPPEVLVRAIQSVGLGSTYFSPEVQDRLVIESNGVSLKFTASTKVSSLTPRELEVLRYIAKGLSKKEIANTLHLSVKTVENHVARVMGRLNIHDRVELTRFAIREGLAEA
ncbi:MAG: LuxR C-terminal-related transcriptional regulator [Phycisphaerales bacterium]|nr:MAG: response regulator transcription factor [Phycisphaerales bacterium]